MCQSAMNITILSYFVALHQSSGKIAEVIPQLCFCGVLAGRDKVDTQEVPYGQQYQSPDVEVLYRQAALMPQQFFTPSCLLKKERHFRVGDMRNVTIHSIQFSDQNSKKSWLFLLDSIAFTFSRCTRWSQSFVIKHLFQCPHPIIISYIYFFFTTLGSL